jgi:hypothetical protein
LCFREVKKSSFQQAQGHGKLWCVRLITSAA